ncbi:hypothetical protein KI387_016621 [Taxus chinensis]|uniref:Uncharacterized protein n=1 Tax=Taxus chinensis TaxID=29808 RepID=A0AA38LIB1_TAXCH|nr:hypothetical protein KI387_016621 [Taxus chinensis]
MGCNWSKKSRKDAVVPSDVVHGRPVVSLFGSEICPFTSRIRIALQYKGVNVRIFSLNTENDIQNNKMELLASTDPQMKFPILKCGMDILSGSSDAILQYIEAKFPNPPLVPEGPMADITQNWVVYVRDIFSPLLAEILYDGNLLVQRELLLKLETAFVRLDGGIMEYMNRGPYFLGNQFSMVDVYLIPFLYLTFPLQHFRGVEISSELSHLQRYCRQMLNFPCYSPVRIDLELLQKSIAKTMAERGPPPLVVLTILQHKSMLCHMERLVRSADGLVAAKQQGYRIVDPAKGTIGMQMKKLSKGYAQLVDLMQEHAQMEERIIFPALEKADRGITKVADGEHARDLPIMNGIREDMKTVHVLEAGSPDRSQALLRLSVRLRTLEAHCIEHFKEEEESLLPLLEAANLGNKEQEALLGNCFSIMELSHSQFLPYLFSGLLPHEIQQYFEVAIRCQDKQQVIQMIRSLQLPNDESKTVLGIIQNRLPALTDFNSNA